MAGEHSIRRHLRPVPAEDDGRATPAIPIDKPRERTVPRCIECGAAIGFQRLLEYPGTRLCGTCASEDWWRPSRDPR